MKKLRFFTTAFTLLLCMWLTACGNTKTTTSEKTEIVCTTFVQYDWMRNLIAGAEDHYELTLLLKNGTDMHSYQMTAEDMIHISNCDMFIYVGGESDRWIDDIQANIKNKEQIQVNLMELLGDLAKEEEHAEGMEHDHEEEEEEEAFDEHIWLSLKNTEILLPQLTDLLIKMDPSNTGLYTANLEKYQTELKALDNEYENMIDSAKYDTILFGDRFPFRYLVDDYHLNYFAAFAGCSAETEASFETIAFLAGKMNELHLPAVLIIEKSSDKLAQSIINNTTEKNQEILTLNSLQSITSEEIASDVTYLSVMKNNLEVLRQALN